MRIETSQVVEPQSNRWTDNCFWVWVSY